MESSQHFNDYAYVSVKLAAARTKLIKPQQMSDLLNSGNMTEFMSRMMNAQKISREFSTDAIINSNNLEKTLRDVFFQYMAMFVNHSPAECALLLVMYLQKYEVENLKNLVVSKLVNLDAATLRNNLFLQVETILRTEKVLGVAINAKNLEELIYIYRKTRYHDILHDVEIRYKNTNEIFFVYAILDRFYFETLRRYFDDHPRTRDRDDEFLRRFIGLLIDVYNITMVLRGVNFDFDWRETEFLLVPNKSVSKVSVELLSEMHEIGQDPERMESKIKTAVENHSWAKKFARLITHERLGHSMKSFQFNALLKMFHHVIRTDSSTSQSKFAAILSFMIRKEMEIENIMTIYKGIRNGFASSVIKNYLIDEIMA